MKLLPCPFCGTHRTKLVRWPITPENFGAEIRCECGCHGPAGFGKSCIPMAADLWNRREHSADRIKRLEEALDLVRPTCLFVHHSKKHQHKYNEPCPVVELIEKAKEAKP